MRLGRIDARSVGVAVSQVLPGVRAMDVLASLIDEVKRNEAAEAAMTVLQAALERRSSEEQGAFWHAIGLYYVFRKAPPESSGGANVQDSALGEGA